MKKSRGILSLVIVGALIVFLAFTTAVGIGDAKSGSVKNIKLGLDLAGGVSITYQVKDADATAEEIADTKYKLQKRVEQYSTESSVYMEGDDRINIEIPGVTDANEILEELGQPGTLYFIREHDADGNENYSTVGYTGDAAQDYQLNKTIDELKESGDIVVTGEQVSSAQAGTTEDSLGNSEYVVSLVFDDEGTEAFADATTEAYANGDSIGIYYDGAFVSVPNVQSAIEDGQAQISGDMTYEEADQLASTIRIGGLSVELEELRSNVVGASLGSQAISTSLKAGVIGLAIVFIFMILVYLLPGLASSLALIIYTGLVLVILDAFEVTLTLPGIAGIILGIGMAVDANVIIFARVREEIEKGKSVKNSLKTGFQKALSAILDGNITTLIAAIVLYLKGSGTVKGFAQTLGIGIVVSMFTALVVTRLIIFSFYAVGLKDQKLYYRPSKREKKTIGFLGKKKIFFAISIACILAGFVFMGINGGSGKGAFEYSLEFSGGTSTTAEFDKDYSIEEIDEVIVPVVEEITGDMNVQTQKVSGTNQIVIKTKTLDLDTREALDQALIDQFGVSEDTITAENISATVSDEMRSDAIVAVIIATILMLLYIWFRFKDIRFAASAVTALVHDVLVVLAFYAIARISVGNTFIACMLTIVGYSINATIVIFDRIREELKTANRKTDLEDLVNRSITQTLTRSIYTSFTTFVMVAVLYVMGVSSIKEFALPLMVGIVCGGYSSVCITGALWYVMKTKIGKKSK